MKYYYDLHIHSVLSPDADVLMTPHNIFNMSSLKKLDIIAVTDHNSTRQLSICEEIAQSYDMLFIPGIEVSLVEDYHVLVYFENVENALTFNHLLTPWRNPKRYDAMTEHRQGLTDIHDEIIGYESYDLSMKLSLSLLDLQNMLESFRHILVFAHVNRKKQSGLHMLPHSSVHAIELASCADPQFIHEHQLENYHILYNSDAHDLILINERNEHNWIELDDLSMESFFRYFEHG